MKKVLKLFLWWLPPALVLTLFCGLIYVVSQQNLRQSANDPQIQIAEDMSMLLASGIAPSSLISSGVPLDISKSLSTYAAIFDDNGKLVVGSAVLKGQPISLPVGVFDYAKKHGENRFTWEPDSLARGAVVLIHYTNSQQSGFIAVGRSLREVEKREAQLSLQVLMVWLATLIISFITVFFLHRRELAKVSMV